ncbi:MAG: hypothetical protein WB765_15635 [Acidimicrobiales bacterium]
MQTEVGAAHLSPRPVPRRLEYSRADRAALLADQYRVVWVRADVGGSVLFD